jgi:hypothetical protein
VCVVVAAIVVLFLRALFLDSFPRAVRFHIEHDEYEHGEHGQPLDVHGMPVAATDRPAQGAYVPAGAAAPGAASGALLNNVPHHQTAVVPGAHGPAPALGLFPRDMLVRFRSAPALAIITIYLMIVMLVSCRERARRLHKRKVGRANGEAMCSCSSFGSYLCMLLCILFVAPVAGLVREHDCVGERARRGASLRGA